PLVKTIVSGGAGRTKRYANQKATTTSRMYGPSVSARSRQEILGISMGRIMLHPPEVAYCRSSVRQETAMRSTPGIAMAVIALACLPAIGAPMSKDDYRDAKKRI